MLNSIKMVPKAIFQLAVALVLGYCFSVALMKGMLPDSWAVPDGIVFGVVLFLGYHWAKWAGVFAEHDERSRMAQPKSLIAQLIAGDQRHVFRNANSRKARRKSPKKIAAGCVEA